MKYWVVKHDKYCPQLMDPEDGEECYCDVISIDNIDRKDVGDRLRVRGMLMKSDEHDSITYRSE